jgi:hypothetical protein
MNKFLKLDVLNKIIWIGLIIIQKVQNYFYIWNVTVERDLIKSFEETFTKVEQYGNEYFEGDPEDMKVLICSSLNLSYNTKTTCTKKYETEYNVIKAKNQALDLKYETLDLKYEAII